MKKKIIILIIALVLIVIGICFALTSCNKNDGSENQLANDNQTEQAKGKKLSDEEIADLMKVIENSDEKEYEAKVYNEYVESYLEDGKYVISVYKFFSDLYENVSSDTKNFYVRYEDAKEQENGVFNATTDTELAQKVKVLEKGKKELYTYTFEKSENTNSNKSGYKLINYQIGAMDDGEGTTKEAETR